MGPAGNIVLSAAVCVFISTLTAAFPDVRVILLLYIPAGRETPPLISVETPKYPFTIVSAHLTAQLSDVVPQIKAGPKTPLTCCLATPQYEYHWSGALFVFAAESHTADAVEKSEESMYLVGILTGLN